MLDKTMGKFLLSFGVFISLIGIATAENVLFINNTFARPGDTISVSVSISNSQKFISFQFDLLLPDQVSFPGFSIQMSERSTNHVAIGNMVGANHLRIFSYSTDNSVFQGNQGEVISFQLVVGYVHGEFPLIIDNGIIGDSLSQNIMTGSENGILSVFPFSIADPTMNSSTFIKEVMIFPNPVHGATFLQFVLLKECELSVKIIDFQGKVLYSDLLGKFSKNKYRVEITGFIERSKPKGVNYLELYTMPSINQTINFAFIKTVVPFIIKE